MPKTFKFLKWSGKKAVALFVLTIVLAVAAVGSTVAYIVTKTGEVKNTFTPPDLDIEITGDVIENTGDVPVYVRAAIVANWVNETDGSILSTQPELGEIPLKDGWVKGSDGFYYYTVALESKATAPELIESGKLTVPTAPSADYTLQIQVLSSAIQSTPTEAVINSWTAVTGVNADGSLIIAK